MLSPDSQSIGKLSAVLWAGVFWVGILFGSTSSWAVVIDYGDGSGNTTAPSDDPGFANVGTRGVASAIYLGNRWAMTAQHVRPGTVYLGDVAYNIVPTESVRIGNPEHSSEDLSPETDLVLLRLAEDPGLASLRLPCQPVALGSDLLLAGNGHDREPTPTYWSVETGPGRADDVWTEVPTLAESDRHGFKTVPSQSIRWGVGLTGLTDQLVETNDGDVLAFTSSFQDSLNIDHLAQAVRGDSGGAVFQKNLGVWELVGLIFAVDPLENQPESTRTAVYGETTLIVDLFRYRELIRAAADFEPDPVDINGDDFISAGEIDRLMVAQELGAFASCHYDVDQNGIVNSLDVETLLSSSGILIGDADRDGTVGFSDFLTMSGSFGRDAFGWSSGDFDGDGQVSFSDFLKLSGNFGRLSPLPDPVTYSVPEPGSPTWLIALATAFAARYRFRRR